MTTTSKKIRAKIGRQIKRELIHENQLHQQKIEERNKQYSDVINK